MAEPVAPMAITPLSAETEHAALLTMIIERLCIRKADLFWYYANVDELHNGRVCVCVVVVLLLLELNVPDHIVLILDALLESLPSPFLYFIDNYYLV